MKVILTHTALEQIEQTYDFIAEQNAEAAAHWVERLLARTEQLALFPRSGRRVPEYDEPDVLEIFLGDWRIIYRVDGQANSIDVLSVLWGKKPLTPENDD